MKVCTFYFHGQPIKKTKNKNKGSWVNTWKSFSKSYSKDESKSNALQNYCILTAFHLYCFVYWSHISNKNKFNVKKQFNQPYSSYAKSFVFLHLLTIACFTYAVKYNTWTNTSFPSRWMWTLCSRPSARLLRMGLNTSGLFSLCSWYQICKLPERNRCISIFGKSYL